MAYAFSYLTMYGEINPHNLVLLLKIYLKKKTHYKNSVYCFNNKIDNPLGKHGGIQPTCCSSVVIADCGLLPALSILGTISFNRHLLSILSCLISDLGGRCRSSGCQDNK